MITRIGKALAVVATLALLAMPARALAHDEEGESHHGHGRDHGRHLGWNKHHHDEQQAGSDHGRHLGWNKHHHDGDDGDRDDCWYQGQRGHWSQEGNRWQWRAAEGNQPYYGQSSAQGQHRQALINQDRRLREQYRAAFARGDKNAQKRTLELLRETDKGLGMTKQQIAAGVRPH